MNWRELGQRIAQTVRAVPLVGRIFQTVLTPSSQAPRQVCRRWVWGASGFLLLVIGVSGWYLQTRQQALQSAWQQAEAARQNRLASLATRLDQQTQRLTEMHRAVERARAGEGRRAFRLAEVEYLLRVGERQLELLNDPAGAAQALNAAVEVLPEAPELQSLSQRIQQEAARLGQYRGGRESAEVLERLVRDPGPLPPKYTRLQSPAQQKEQAQADAPNPSARPDKALQQRLAERLGRHLQIRRHDQPAQAMPSPATDAFVRQMLILRLELARLAALRGNQADYRHELDAALAWLLLYYDAQSVQPLVAQLTRLRESDLTPEPIDMAELLAMLWAAATETD